MPAYNLPMRAGPFDELEFFQAIQTSGTRALLIGRRAMALPCIDDLILTEAYLAEPIDDEERQSTLELVDWFTRRYPTPLERLRYISKAYRRWSRRQAGPR